jgi:hypothetical protein
MEDKYLNLKEIISIGSENVKYEPAEPSKVIREQIYFL